MTDRERITKALHVLRGASVRKLAGVTGIDRDRVYRALYALVGKRLVNHTGKAHYCLTRRGRATANEGNLFGASR